METCSENLEHADSKAARARLVADLKSLVRDSEDLMQATAGEVGEKIKETRTRPNAALERAKETCENLQTQTADTTRAAVKKADTMVRRIRLVLPEIPERPLLGLAQNRVELFAVELQEEKVRAVRFLAWIMMGLTVVAAGLLMGLGALAFYLWTTGGFPGVIGLALVSLCFGAGALHLTLRRIKNDPKPFAETISAFRKDRECLRRYP